MPTTLVWPDVGNNEGWFDDYARGKAGRPSGSYDELVSHVPGTALSADDSNNLVLWAVFHKASVSAPVEDGSDLHTLFLWVKQTNELVKLLFDNFKGYGNGI